MARPQNDIDESQIDDSGRAAIKWMVALTSGAMTDRQIRYFDHWGSASAQNAEAWNRMSGGLRPFDVLAHSGLPRGTASRLSGQPVRRDRRAVLAGLVGFVGVGSVGTASLQRFMPLEDVFNDRYTRTAEHDRFRLADNSEVVLAPRSSINLTLTSERRGLELVRGRMMLDVAEQDPRPFVVDLGLFRLDATAGSFDLDRRDGHLAVTGLKGSGTLEGGGRRLKLRASERISYDGSTFTESKANAEIAASWTTGFAVFEDELIATIVDQIRPYYAGFIRISPEALSRRATGVFNVFDPIVALDTLARSVQLKMTHTAGIWIKIEV